MRLAAPERHVWQGRPVLCPHCGGESSVRSRAWLRWGHLRRVLAGWRAFETFTCTGCGHTQFFR